MCMHVCAHVCACSLSTGAREALTAPGEWYVERVHGGGVDDGGNNRGNTLHLWPNSTTPSLLVAAMAETALVLRDQRDITFSGVSFVSGVAPRRGFPWVWFPLGLLLLLVCVGGGGDDVCVKEGGGRERH